MKKSMIIGIVIVIILLIAIVEGYFMLNSNKCIVSDSSKCDKSCKVDSDCKRSSCSCINKDEIMANPDNLMVDCMMFDCKCVNNKCASTNSICKKEGELGSSLECCNGLKAISDSKPDPNNSSRCLNYNHTICINCGDGVCGIGENKCNCPEDCENNSNYKCFNNLSSCQYCKKDNECKLNCNFCINTNEVYEIPPNILAVMGAPAPCPNGLSCFCIDNKCEAKIGLV